MGSVGGTGWEPVQSRRMDKQDIRNVRLWHRQAALRARRAGFDIVYCYAGHGMTVAMQFLMRRCNDRTDEYGGTLENRARLLRELVEETKNAVGDRARSRVRLSVDELLGADASRTRAKVTMSSRCWPSCRTCGRQRQWLEQ